MLCNTHSPLAPATAKFQAKILGVPRIREGWISWGTEDTVSLLSILLHRTMIPGKAAKREEIKHSRDAFLWAMGHCKVWIQEEFLAPLPVIARASCTHSPRMLSLRMYKWHVSWQKQQFNSPPGFSHLYCVLCSLILALPLDVRERQMLAAGLSWGPATGKLTVLCSSPSRMWNVCSNTVYMILPIPNDGSITFGMISSTGTQKNPRHH